MGLNPGQVYIPEQPFVVMPHAKGVDYGVIIFDWLGGKKMLPGKDRPYAIYLTYKALRGMKV